MILPRLFFKNEFTPFEPLILKYSSRRAIIPAGTILYDTISTEHMSYYIYDGIVKHFLINDSGNETLFYFLGKGSIFPINCMDTIFSLENYLMYAAVTQIHAIRFPSKKIIDMVHESKEMAAEVINHECRASNLLTVRELLSTYNDSMQLLSSFLYLYVSQHCSNEDVISISQEKLGELAGLSRPQIVRVLSQLRKEGIIRTSNKKIQILDLEGLKNHCNKIVHE